MSGFGNVAERSTKSERSMSSKPRGTATESLGKPVTADESSTLPASPARSTLEVRGTTWVCHTSTCRTSSDETTTQGRRLSSSTQQISPRVTKGQTCPCVQWPCATLQLLGRLFELVQHQRAAVERTPIRIDSRREDEADQPPKTKMGRPTI